MFLSTIGKCDLIKVNNLRTRCFQEPFHDLPVSCFAFTFVVWLCYNQTVF